MNKNITVAEEKQLLAHLAVSAQGIQRMTDSFLSILGAYLNLFSKEEQEEIKAQISQLNAQINKSFGDAEKK
ncbi:hypothetical protein [Capybara microvirus Cap1_SP_217]|nr:hypothetical protein [Capybara microvirus Cap1_SP_217]